MAGDHHAPGTSKEQNMRKATLSIAATVAVIGIGGAALAGGFQYRTTATGAEEVPVRSTSAEAKINVMLGDGSASYNLRFTEPISDVTQSHLHRAAVGVNGPIAVWLYPSAPPASLIPGVSEGRLIKSTFDAADLCYVPTAPYCVAGAGNWDAFVADLEAGNLYLNVHTSAFPGGEIRGQMHANHAHGG
jgi:hypothetical protein